MRCQRRHRYRGRLLTGGAVEQAIAVCLAVPASDAPKTRRPKRCKPALRPGNRTRLQKAMGMGTTGLDTSVTPVRAGSPGMQSQQ
jgi:hypothetical protein